MSSNIGIGVPVPKLLPITGTWTFPFAAYLALLSNRVAYRRMKNEKFLGETVDSDNELQVDSRAHANFLENVPLAFAMATVAELNGANRTVLNYALAALFAFRVMHVELGLKSEANLGWGRPTGYYGTQGIITGLATYASWLVKGYWGF